MEACQRYVYDCKIGTNFMLARLSIVEYVAVKNVQIRKNAFRRMHKLKRILITFEKMKF